MTQFSSNLNLLSYFLKSSENNVSNLFQRFIASSSADIAITVTHTVNVASKVTWTIIVSSAKVLRLMFHISVGHSHRQTLMHLFSSRILWRNIWLGSLDDTTINRMNNICCYVTQRAKGSILLATLAHDNNLNVIESNLNHCRIFRKGIEINVSYFSG